MKRFWALLVAAQLFGLAPAEGERALMVLKTTGPVPRSLDVGIFLAADQEIEVPAQCSLTLLVLGKGSRVKISGPCKAKLHGQQIEADGKGHVQDVAGTPHRLRLNGENHRQVGGQVLRIPLESKNANCAWHLGVTPFPGATLRIAGPATPSKPALKLSVYGEYTKPNVDFVLDAGFRQGLGKPLATPPLPVPVRENDSWVYSLELPSAWKGRSLGLLLEQEGKPVLYSPLYAWSQADSERLQQCKQETLAWAKQEPQSIEPWVVYAVQAEELGQLQEALDSVQEAIGRAQKANTVEPGLYATAARLQFDLGQYKSAVSSVQKSLQAETARIH